MENIILIRLYEGKQKRAAIFHDSSLNYALCIMNYALFFNFLLDSFIQHWNDLVKVTNDT